MQANHNEPWDWSPLAIYDQNGDEVASWTGEFGEEVMSNENKKRVVDCVNAMAGVRLGERNLYLLQNMHGGYLGNSPVFWSESGGYTQWIDEAKRWTKEEAESQIQSTRGTHLWKMWPIEWIQSAARRTVDIQDLRKIEDAV